MAGVKHATQSILADDPASEISSGEWNADHTIDDNSVAPAKLAASATDKVFGRSTAGAGAGEEIALTAAGRALIDDASAAAQATTLGLGTADSPQHAGVNIGHATDTTLGRTSAGVANVEGKDIYMVGGADVAIADGGTGAGTAAAAATALGLGTGNSPQFTGIEVGHATDTTLTRASAGDVAVEGNRVMRIGGVDLPVADGGTGASDAATARTNLGVAPLASPTFTGVVTTAGQIAFPATANPSADANTLDDYEEGTWTTVIGGATSESGQTYALQDGSYVKIGRSVLVRWNVTLTAKGTITGNIRLKGLPFTVITGHTQANMGYWFGLATAYVHVSGYAQNSTTYVVILGITAAATGTSTALTTTNVSDTTQLIGTLHYEAA